MRDVRGGLQLSRGPQHLVVRQDSSFRTRGEDEGLVRSHTGFPYGDVPCLAFVIIVPACAVYACASEHSHAPGHTPYVSCVGRGLPIFWLLSVYHDELRTW